MQAFIQAIISGLLAGGIYSLVSVGLALIVGVIELVNFAQADYLMVAMYVAYWCVTLLGIDPYLSTPIVLAVMIAFGLVTFYGVMKRVLHANHEIRMLSTLAISMILQNLALMLFKADFRNVRTAYSSATFKLGGFIFNVPRTVAFCVAMLVSLALYLFLQKTFTGTSMRAISQNNKAAKLMGIKLIRTYAMAFTMGISVCAFAGVLLIPAYPAYPMVGGTFMLPSFVVVTIGGLSNIGGAIVAGLLVGVVESLAAYLFGPSVQQVAYFILFLVVVLLKPDGILSRKREGV